MNSKKRIEEVLREAFGGGMESPASHASIAKYSDTPLIKDIIKFFKDLDGSELINIIGNGDMWQMDIRTELDTDETPQNVREIGKQLAHEIKDDLDSELLEQGHNVPNMSVAGVRTVNNMCEFTINFIYAYKANVRDLYEQKKRAKGIVKNILKKD